MWYFWYGEYFLVKFPTKQTMLFPVAFLAFGCSWKSWTKLFTLTWSVKWRWECPGGVGSSQGGVGRFWAVWDHPMRFRLSTPKAPLMTPVVMWRPEQPLRVPPVPPRAVLFPSGTTVGPGRPRQGFGFCFVCDAKSADSFEQGSEVIWVLKETPAEEQSGETEVSESLSKSSRPLHPPRELQGCELTLVFPAQSLSVCPRASKSTMPGPP